MSSLHGGDNWEVFVAQRERMPSWKLPFNIAVMLHILVFAGSVIMPDVGKKPEPNEMIVIDLLSLPPADSGPMAAQQVVQPQGKKKIVASKPIEPAQAEVAPQPTFESEPVASPPEPTEEVVLSPAPKIALQPEVSPAPVAEVKSVSLRPLKRKKRLAEDVRLAEVKEQEQRQKAQEQSRLAALKKKRLAEQRKREQAAEEKRKIVARKKKQQKAAARTRQAQQQAAQQRRSQEVAKAARLAREAEQAAEQALLEAARIRNEYASVSQAVADLNAPLVSGGTGFSSGGGRRGYGGSGNAQANPAAVKQYAASLHTRISSNWRLPEILKRKSHLKALVALTVGRDGSIKDMRIEQKSGDSVFDQSVLKALQNAAPLPGFPAVIDQSSLEFALNFTPDGLGYF